jgi:hypothetical protein
MIIIGCDFHPGLQRIALLVKSRDSLRWSAGKGVSTHSAA